MLAAALAILGAAGCGSSVTDADLRENPGTLVVPSESGEVSGLQGLVWTKDASEIVFHSSQLKAVSVGSHTVRPVWGESAVVNFAGPTVSGRIYFSTFLPTPSTSAEYAIGRVEPGTGVWEVLPLQAPALTIAIDVSPNERYVVGDAIYDLQTGGKASSFPYTPLGFSPDGNAFVARDAFTSALVVMDGQGSHQQLATSDEAYIAHRWALHVPLLLRRRYDAAKANIRLYEVDGLSSVSHDLAELNATSDAVYAKYSADGSLLGIWLQDGTLWKLYKIRAGGTPTFVASVRYDLGSHPSPPVFSPDGTSVAYFFFNPGRSLYVRSGI